MKAKTLVTSMLCLGFLFGCGGLWGLDTPAMSSDTPVIKKEVDVRGDAVHKDIKDARDIKDVKAVDKGDMKSNINQPAAPKSDIKTNLNTLDY